MKHIHCFDKLYILMNLVMFIIIENTFSIVLHRMYIFQSKVKVISFRFMYIHLMYDDRNIHCVDELYILMN